MSLTNECGCQYGNCTCDRQEAPPVTYYKIHDRLTGLYSTGGNYPHWTKNGKSWTRIGHVKNHIKQLVSSQFAKIDGWELVEFTLKEGTVKPLRQLSETVRPRRR